MHRFWRLLVVGLLGWAAGQSHAAHTRARLVFDAASAPPGHVVWAGVHLHMEGNWHTYWRNAGESGAPTTIRWELPPGITAGEIHWPSPEKHVFGGITTYVYHREVVLLVPLTLAASISPGPVEIRAQVAWLECEDVCLPGEQKVAATLVVGSEFKPSAEAALLEAWQKKLPRPADELGVVAAWERPADGNQRPLILQWNAAAPPEHVEFFPYASDNFEVLPESQRLPFDGGKARLRLTVKRLGAEWPSELTGVLTQQLPGQPEAVFELRVAIQPMGSLQGAGGVERGLARLLQMLGFAFLGGLILNIMPCVFPVIALKILGFVQQSRESPARVLQHGLIYTAGVLASFLALAVMVIVVQQAGGAASWGMQLQSPQFSVILTAVIVLVALNLFGVFEVNPGGRTLTVVSKLAGREGHAGTFFTGALATVLATPCTAPFLAPALGFAFTQPPPMILLFFITVGLGLAAPYIVLSWRPAWLRFLPRPGVWMERFKVAMGFPMLATAVWLFSFTAKRFGDRGPLWLGLFLVGLALAAWVWGEFVQRGRTRKGWAAAVAVALVVAGYFGALERELNWRRPATASASAPAAKHGGIAWQPWSPEAVEAARAAGRVVLVDFTADWCLTCQYNLRTAIDVPEVRARLRELDAVALLADNTNPDPRIVAELQRHNRAGVPLVLVYPRNPARPPVVLPALLTKGLVLDALDQAAAE